MNAKIHSVFSTPSQVREDIKYLEMIENGQSDFVKGIEYIFNHATKTGRDIPVATREVAQ